jgi:3-hydroxyacyl-CoA dehydrogenase/enoyl-CoA hydratase/3-hydroxybutyryl-CoA epimerase/3-hydroxyacyl-CoA dehydrogenase/enoyl-CoA hydratase/3-hydroxybutyryl-CoA epimerase/enoyl-CoA isomerase
MTATPRAGADAAGSAFRLEIRDDGIGLVTFDQPNSRANTLSQQALAELEMVVAQVEQRADLRGLVLQSGKPGMFIAGADLRELGSGQMTLELARKITQRGLDLFTRFEALAYPTVALIDGACMGGGLELALAFDYRLAGSHPKTEIGLPEVKIGLMPGWGGTQRLSRIVGPALAAELICAGETVAAARARELGMVFDVVSSERLLHEAVRLLEWTRQTEAWRGERQRKQQPVGLSDAQQGFMFAVARAQVLAKTKGQLPAPLAALDAIAKGCNRPLDEGLQAETQAFLPLVGSPIARNLIAVFFMTQRLQKDPGVADSEIRPRAVERVGVVGAGIMGSGIAGAHIRRGIPVTMLDVNNLAIDKGLASITKVMQSRIEIGRMTQAEAAMALGQLSTATALGSLAESAVLIEAVVEKEEAKVQLYRDVQPLLRPDAILASNTSTISITRMGRSVARAENFAGMHFFNPVDRMQLVEVIRGEATGDVAVATLVALAKRIGKTPIVVRDCPGFLVNRILFPYLNESVVLLEEGAEPRAIDRAATDFGMPMGPVTLNDLVGLDTSLYAGRVINTAFADRAPRTRLLNELVSAGRLGQKSGAGFYSYAKGSRGSDDPAFTAILERCRTGRREIGAEELGERLFLPMLVEASRVLEESIVREPGDVDMGLILGIGFPAFKGGILRWADTEGLARIVEKLSRYERLGRRYQPTAEMRRLAAERKGYYPSA